MFELVASNDVRRRIGGLVGGLTLVLMSKGRWVCVHFAFCVLSWALIELIAMEFHQNGWFSGEVS
jgi:hypothetical protein